MGYTQFAIENPSPRSRDNGAWCWSSQAISGTSPGMQTELPGAGKKPRKRAGKWLENADLPPKVFNRAMGFMALKMVDDSSTKHLWKWWCSMIFHGSLKLPQGINNQSQKGYFWWFHRYSTKWEFTSIGVQNWVLCLTCLMYSIRSM